MLSHSPISRGTNNSVLVQLYKILQKDCAKRPSHSPISRGQFSEMENFLKICRKGLSKRLSQFSIIRGQSILTIEYPAQE